MLLSHKKLESLKRTQRSSMLFDSTTGRETMCSWHFSSASNGKTPVTKNPLYTYLFLSYFYVSYNSEKTLQKQ